MQIMSLSNGWQIPVGIGKECLLESCIEDVSRKNGFSVAREGQVLIIHKPHNDLTEKKRLRVRAFRGKKWFTES